MGFCKRCGDIITTEKCRKCGGQAVSGVVKFNGLPGSPTKADRWEKKYTHRRSASPPPHGTLKQLDPNTFDNTRYPTIPSPKKRFPRPTSIDIKGGYPRPQSTSTFSLPAVKELPPLPSLPEGATAALDATGPVVRMDDGLTLAKVHGTVLAPADPIHCAHCRAVFPPNSTLYPVNSGATSAFDSDSSQDPFILSPSERNTALSGPYDCLACFTKLRSLGSCGACGKAVLPLKSEGAWITVRDSVWHGKCFTCRGCGVDLSKRPMVGIGGEPECEECFGRVGKMQSNPSTPVKKSSGDERKERTREAMVEMNGRFGTPRTPSTPKKSTDVTTKPSTPINTSSSAPTISASDNCGVCNKAVLPQPGQSIPLVTAQGKQYHASCFTCQFCSKPFAPTEGEGESTAVFTFVDNKPAHPTCAPITVKSLPSSPKRIESERTASPAPAPAPTSPSKAAFPLPAPTSPTKRPLALVLPQPLGRSPSKSRPSSLFFPPPAPASAALPRPASPLKSPTFGTALHCPACGKGVSPMERGTVPGPGGGRWHAGCLKCGAENRVELDLDEAMEGVQGEGGMDGDGDREMLKGRGCGKKLDTGAKEAGGRVWCRRCWDDLPPTVRPVSPTRATPLSPMHTGLALSNIARAPSARTAPIFPRPYARRESVALTPQMTGTGLLVNRQLTGNALLPSALARQVTGTGQTSPSREAGMEKVVRQMTGNGTGVVTPGRRPRGTMFSPRLGGMMEDLMED